MESPILIAGRSGRLAGALTEAAASMGLPIAAVGRPNFNIEDPISIKRIVAEYMPCAIINAAGFVVVDEAERDPKRAFSINRDGAVHLAREAAQAGIPYLHVSSDYVFDGRKDRPYVEDDPTFPVSVYGKSKAAGERDVLGAYPAAVVVRTSWVFGPHGQSFLTTMLQLARTRDVVQVVADQQGSPTAAPELARGILEIISQLSQHGWQNRGGTYHLAGTGETTWFHFAERIFASWAQRGHKVPRVEPITSAQWTGAARRPAYSVLDCAKVERVFGLRLPHWQDSLDQCLDVLDATSKAPHENGSSGADSPQHVA